MSLAGRNEMIAVKARSLLRAIHADVEQIESSAVVSPDGITLASVLGEGADEHRFGAMCASLLALAARATREVDCGELRQVILDGTRGPTLLTHAGKVAVLAVAARPNSNLGRLILETRKAALELGKLEHD